MSERTLSAGQKRLYTILMLLIPIAFLGLLEVGLNLFSYGNDYPLFTPLKSVDGYSVQSRTVMQRYFSPPTKPPASNLDVFRTQKTDSTYRIVVQGGSSAAGFPFYYGGAFSRMLEVRLQAIFPEKEIEVINTATAAINSYTLLDITDEIIAIEPDLVLMYAGHNEYYGALGIGSAESLGQFRPVVNFYLKLRKYKTVQMIEDFMRWVAKSFADESANPKSGTLMERMVKNQSIPYNSVEHDMGVAQFEGNIGEILDKYKSAGVPVYIGTLASNEKDQRPFVSNHTVGIDLEMWETTIDLAKSAIEENQLGNAVANLEIALSIDPYHAESWWMMGNVFVEIGAMKKAREAYQKARDYDQLRFRASGQMNEVIRRLAARDNVYLVETEKALSDASPNGIIGHEMMLEHLHPTVDGYFEISETFLSALQENSEIGSWGDVKSKEWSHQNMLISDVDRLVGEYRIAILKGGWPFLPAGGQNNVLANIKPENQIEQIALDLYTDKIQWEQAQKKIYDLQKAAGDYDAAIHTLKQIIQQYPFSDSPWLLGGNYAMETEHFSEALRFFRGAYKINKTSPAGGMVGTILLQRGQHFRSKPDVIEAIPYLKAAISINSRDEQMLYNLAGAYAILAEYDQSRAVVHDLLKVNPNHTEGQMLLGSLPAE